MQDKRIAISQRQWWHSIGEAGEITSLVGGYIKANTQYLVEAKEAQVTDHIERADPGSSCDLTCHLQADLDNLQGVGKDHLGAPSLEKHERVRTCKTPMAPTTQRFIARRWETNPECLKCKETHCNIIKKQQIQKHLHLFLVLQDTIINLVDYMSIIYLI